MITITIEDTGIRARIAKVPETMRTALVKGMSQAGDIVRRAADAQIGPGGVLGRRTGNLKRALYRGPVQEDADGRLGFDLGVDLRKAPYGRLQHEGGTIVPKNAQHLAIPLRAMLTGNGVARGTARAVISDPQAFGFTGTFTAKGVIFGTLGRTKGGERQTRTMPDTGEIRTTVPLFALKDSVVIPSHPYLTIALRTTRAQVLGVLEQAVSEGLANG